MKRILFGLICLILIAGFLPFPKIYAEDFEVNYTFMDSGTTVGLTSIWGSSATDIFAVGGGSIFHFDGTSWTKMFDGAAGEISGYSSSRVYAISGKTDLLYYNGTEWTIFPYPSALPSDSYYTAIWCSPAGECYIAGQAYELGIEWNIDRCLNKVTSGGFYPAPSEVGSHRISDIWGSSENDIYVVGLYDIPHRAGPAPDFMLKTLVSHYDGTSWTHITSGDLGVLPVQYLSAIWGSSPNDVYTVGSGLIFHYNGSSWSAVTDGPNGGHAIWGTSDDNVFVLNSDGLYHYNGVAWSDIGPTGNAIWGASATDIFVVGANGSIVRYDFSNPTVSSFTPSSGCVGTSVNITGTNLSGATSVRFGDTSASSFIVNSATQITAIVGSGTTGQISLTTPGIATSTDSFTYCDTVTINLEAGWNLFSTPWYVDGAGTSPDIFFAALGTNLNSVYAFDACAQAASQWSAWNKVTGGALTIDDGKGYWVNVTSPATIVLTGTLNPTNPLDPIPQYNVCNGWNLIGFKNGSNTAAISDYLDPPLNFSSIYTFDNGIWKIPTNLQPGQGYWIYFNHP